VTGAGQPQIYLMFNLKFRTMKTYAIVVRGDSYYSTRIKRESCVILENEMHNYVGLLGMYPSQFVGSIKDVKKELRKMASDCDEAESIWPNGKGFEDNLVYYEILSRSEIKRLYNYDVLAN
jgi:hypothetical protein